MNRELKDLLKPPFVTTAHGVMDNSGLEIVRAMIPIETLVAQAMNEKWERDLGNIESEKVSIPLSLPEGCNAEEWFKAAVKEKLENDNYKNPCPTPKEDEPTRWKEVANSSDWKCPDCKKEFYFNGHSPDELNYNYCPNCGKRLLPSEEKKNVK